jgi:hypothetical protein
MKKTREENQEPEELILELNWRIPEAIISRYATNMMIQETPQEYILMFFEARPPLLLTQAEVEAQREQRTPLDAVCVSRIIITRDRLQSFVEVLKRVVDKGESPLEANE